MRVVHTFVVRLLADTEEPGVLRGSVRAVANAQDHAFSDGAMLLALLRALCNASLVSGPSISAQQTECLTETEG